MTFSTQKSQCAYRRVKSAKPSSFKTGSEADKQVLDAMLELNEVKTQTSQKATQLRRLRALTQRVEPNEFTAQTSQKATQLRRCALTQRVEPNEFIAQPFQKAEQPLWRLVCTLTQRVERKGSAAALRWSIGIFVILLQAQLVLAEPLELRAINPCASRSTEKTESGISWGFSNFGQCACILVMLTAILFALAGLFPGMDFLKDINGALGEWVHYGAAIALVSIPMYCLLAKHKQNIINGNTMTLEEDNAKTVSTDDNVMHANHKEYIKDYHGMRAFTDLSGAWTIYSLTKWVFLLASAVFFVLAVLGGVDLPVNAHLLGTIFCGTSFVFWFLIPGILGFRNTPMTWDGGHKEVGVQKSDAILSEHQSIIERQLNEWGVKPIEELAPLNLDALAALTQPIVPRAYPEPRTPVYIARTVSAGQYEESQVQPEPGYAGSATNSRETVEPEMIWTMMFPRGIRDRTLFRAAEDREPATTPDNVRQIAHPDQPYRERAPSQISEMSGIDAGEHRDVLTNMTKLKPNAAPAKPKIRRDSSFNTPDPSIRSSKWNEGRTKWTHTCKNRGVVTLDRWIRRCSQRDCLKRHPSFRRRMGRIKKSETQKVAC